jgi:truncated hemoglobin YjbI
MSLVRAAKRKKMAEASIRGWIIDLAKAADERKGDNKYFHDLVDALTMAAHILNNTPLRDWNDEERE